MACHFYKIMTNGYENTAGTISCPNDFVCPYIHDGEEVTLDAHFYYELHDGKFSPFDYAPNRVRLVNEPLKELLELYSEKEWIEFIPVMVRSKEYGDRQYYIVQFKKIYDVIDEKNTTYDPPGWIMKLCVDCNKVKGLDVFNTQPYINDLIVSAKVYKEIKKRKLSFGTSFGVIQCLNRDEQVK